MPYRTDPLIIGGNMAGWTSKTTNANRIIIWNEENRVKSITDSGSATEFLYDDSGERAVKGGGGNETVYLNRFYSLKNGDLGSKHIFAGETRICTKIEKDGGSIQSGVPGWSAFDGSGRDGLYNALSRGNTTKIDYKRGGDCRERPGHSPHRRRLRSSSFSITAIIWGAAISSQTMQDRFIRSLNTSRTVRPGWRMAAPARCRTIGLRQGA